MSSETENEFYEEDTSTEEVDGEPPTTPEVEVEPEPVVVVYPRCPNCNFEFTTALDRNICPNCLMRN